MILPLIIICGIILLYWLVFRHIKNASQDFNDGINLKTEGESKIRKKLGI